MSPPAPNYHEAPRLIYRIDEHGQSESAQSRAAGHIGLEGSKNDLVIGKIANDGPKRGRNPDPSVPHRDPHLRRRSPR